MSASWPHESFFFLSPLIYNYLDIHNQAQVIFTQHTRIPEGSSHLYVWKWVDWTSEEAAEPREWWHRRWWVKEVSGNLPSHTCCSWRDPILSEERLQCLGRGKGKGRRELKRMHFFLSALITARGPPTNFWGSPTRGSLFGTMGTSKAHVLSTHLSPHCCQHFPFFFFF